MNILEDIMNMDHSHLNHTDHPVSLYAATKKMMAHLYDISTTGLRFLQY